MKAGYSVIALIVDRSGSMSGIESDTIGGINSFINKQKNTEGEASFSLILFDDVIETVYDFTDIKHVKDIDSKIYFPRNSTALLDAIGITAYKIGKRLSDMKEEDRPEKVTIAVITDGQENTSKQYKKQQIQDMIKHQEQVYNWDFNFISADLNALKDAQEQYGFCSGKTAFYSKDCSSATFSSLSDKTSRYRSCSVASNSVDANFTSVELSAMVTNTAARNI